MDRTKAAAIVNDFFADMNPSLWNGSTSMPKSFDNRAWQYPLTDDINLEYRRKFRIFIRWTDRKIYKIFLFLVKQKEKTYEISKCYI